ncbi:hypothetical protein H1R20_g7678, partial [Candolleomyces eurysporus]
MLGEISFDSVRKINVAIVSSLAESTCAGYGAGLLWFTEFCDREGVSEYSRMPTSTVLLAAFVADQALKASSSSINSWMSAVRAWHVINNAPWYGSSEFVCQVKLGSLRMAPVSSKKIPCNPLTLEHMLTLQKALNLSDSFDAAVWAVACVAFWACCRLGELTVSSKKLFSPRHDADRFGHFLYSLSLMLTFPPYTQIYCHRDVCDLPPHLILLSLFAAGVGLLPHPMDKGLEGCRS